MIDRQKTLSVAQQLFNDIDAHLEGITIPSDDTRKALAVAAYRLTISHYDGITSLMLSGNTSSALALARPQLEAYFKGTWLERKAKPSSIHRVAAGEDCFPDLAYFFNLKPRADSPDTWIHEATADEKFAKALHGATHGGAIQLNRMFLGDDHIGFPEGYWDEQLAALMYLSNTLAAQAATAITRVLDDGARKGALRSVFETLPSELIALKAILSDAP